jgi:uncharacterized protein YjbI with pentapeptide repeats
MPNEVTIRPGDVLTSEVFRDVVFEGVDFRGVQVVGARFEGCSFTDCTFTDEVVTDSVFEACSFTRVDFDGTNLSDTSFAGSTFAGCTMRGSFAERVDLSGTQLSGTGDALDATDCFWWDAVLDGCEAAGVQFTGATLVGTSFARAVLIDASFRDALLLDCWLVDAVLAPPSAFGRSIPYSTGDGEGFETTLGWDDLLVDGSNLGSCCVDFSGLRHNTDEEHDGSEPCDEDGCPLWPPGTMWPAGFEPGPANATRDEVALGDL